MRFLRLMVALTALLITQFDTLSAQVDSVRYMLTYDTTNCRYTANLVIVGGEAYSAPNRAQFNAQYTIVTPSSSGGITIVESHNPIRNNATFQGTQPAPWNISTLVEQPQAANYVENFYSVTPSLSPTAYYDSLNTGDIVPLFSFVVNPINFCGDSIRPFENGVDPGPSGPGMGGGDFSNGFTIGGFAQKYVGNVEGTPPPSPVLSAMTTCASGIEIDLTAISSSCQSPFTFGWQGPQGYTGLTEDVAINPSTTSNSGTYSVTVTDAFGCMSTLDVTAVSKPDAGADQIACAGGAIIIQGVDPIDGAWSADPANPAGASMSGSLVGSATVDFTSSATGSYNFIYSANGCSDTLSITVESSDAGPDPNDPLCYSVSSATLSANPSQMGIWSVGSNSAGTANITDPNNPNTTVNGFSAPGDYFLVWTVNTCADTVMFTANDNCDCVIANNTLPPFNPNSICGTSGNILIDGGNVTNSGTYSWEYSLNGGAYSLAPGTNNQEDYTTEDLSAGAHAFRRIFTTDTGIVCNDTSNQVLLNVFDIPSAPANLVAIPNPICVGETVDLSVDNNPLATYTWTADPNIGSGLVSSMSFVTSMTPTQAGNYTISVTQTVDGCESSPTSVLVEVFETPPTPSLGTISANDPSNCGAADGNIQISGYNSNETYDVEYTYNGNIVNTSITSDGSGIIVIGGLVQGSYSNITITNSSNCDSGTFTGTITLSDPNPPPAPENIVASPTQGCVGTPITISVDNTPGATYTWSASSPDAGLGSSTTNSVVMVATASGLFTIEVYQTINGCSSQPTGIDVLINDTPPTPTQSTVNGTDPTTCGGTDGFITLSSLNPFVTYIVNYNDNGNDVTDTLSTNSLGQLFINNLGEGVYTNFSLANFVGCGSGEYAGPITLSDPNSPPAPTNLQGTPDPSCLGDMVNLSVDGVPGTTFNWSVNSGDAMLDGSTDNTNVFTTVSPGVFSVSVSQTLAGCTSPAVSLNLTVFNIPPEITGAIESDPTVCSGTNGSITLTGLDVSTSYTLNYNFNGNPVSLMQTTNASGEIFLAGLSSGVYSDFQVFNAAGCSNSVFAGPINLVDPSAPDAPTGLTAVPARVCLGETFDLSVDNTPGAVYSWSATPATNGIVASSTNTTTMTPTAVGTYTISVFQTIGGCVSPASTLDVIVDPLPPTPDPALISVVNPSQCLVADGSITLGGYEPFRSYTVTYTFDGNVIMGTFSTNGQGEFIIPDLASGSYTNFTMTNSGGCTSLQYPGPVNLVDPGAPAAPENLTANPNPVCLGNEVALSVTNNPAATYTWSASSPDAGLVMSSGNTTTMDASAAGNYTISVIQTIAGCTSPPSNILVQVIDPPYTPVIDNFTGTDPSGCGINDGNITISGFTPNTTFTVNYTFDGSPQTAMLTSNGIGEVIITNLGPGNYTNFQFTNSGGCDSDLVTEIITLNGPQAPPAPTGLTGIPNPICQGGLVLLSVDNNPSATYTWSASSPAAGLVNSTTSSTSMQATAPGSYTIEVFQTINGCSSPAATINIVVNALPPDPDPASVSFTDPSACSVNDGSITIAGYMPATNYTIDYLLNASPQSMMVTSDGSGAVSLINLVAGTYSGFRITTEEGCSSGIYPGPVTLSEPDIPDAPLGLIATPNPVCPGETVNLQVDNNPGASYNWFVSPSGGLGQSTSNTNTFLPDGPGIYTVSVSQTVTGCTSPLATIDIEVRNDCLNPDFGVTFNDISLSGNLSTNDKEEIGSTYGPATANGTNPSSDLPMINSNGNYTFVSSVAGEYNYLVQVCKPGQSANCTQVPLVITVLDEESSDNPPVVNHDYIGVNSGNSIVINISSNDRCQTVPNCILTSTTVVTSPAHGVFNTSTLTYTPDPGYVGRDSFRYESCQNPIANPVNCDQEWVYINVFVEDGFEFTNAMDDYAETNINTQLIGNVFDGVSSNDQDPLGLAQRVNGFSSTIPGKGDIILNNDGSYTFTPETDFYGPVDFAYEVCRSQTALCDSATLHILVHPLAASGVLGDYVWMDTDGDGIQDSNEPPVPDVIVLLYNEQNILVNSTLTDAGGYYLFSDVLEGTYYLEFMTPTDLLPTFAGKGNPDIDSDVTNANGPNTTDFFYLTGGETNLSVDAGFYQCVKIGNNVWYDDNENDIFDDYENGINGIKVRLWRLGENGYELWETTVTGHKPGTPSDDGYFQFCAPPGTYYIEVVVPPLGLVLVRPNIGNDEYRDSDITGANGPNTSHSFTLISGTAKDDLGAGFYPMATAGNLVWMDNNNNGIQDPNEPKVSGVLVQAYDAVNGQMLGEAVTNALGVYEIDYLEKRDVYLKFTPPAGYSPTINGAGDDSMDSDVDHSFGLNTTRMFSLQPGLQLDNIDLGISQGVLPVEWNSISAYKEESNNTIEWSTSSEINVDYFVVERKLDTETEFTEMSGEKIKSKNKLVNQYVAFDYSLTNSENYYYRIKQVDYDGTYTYSDEVVVYRPNSRGYIHAYPNPFVSHLDVDYVADIGESAIIDVYNRDGRLIKSLIAKSNNNGLNTYRVEMQDTPNGIYTISVKIGNLIKRMKFVKVD